MISGSFVYLVVFITSVFISAVSQVLLKKAAETERESFLGQYLNAPVVIAYALFFFSTVITVYAYRGIPLSMGSILESLSYVFVAVLGYCVLGERVSPRKVLGIALIVIGVVVFSL